MPAGPFPWATSPVTATKMQGPGVRLGRLPARTRRQRQGNRAAHVRLVCATAVLVADLVAFLVAQIGAWALTEALEARVWPDAPLQVRTGLPIDAVLLVGVVLFLAGHSHYGRRVPFWTELRALCTAAAAALVGSGFIQFSLQRHDSRILVVLGWVLFPPAVLLLRAAVRRVLTAFSLWQLRVVVVGERLPAKQAVDALLSEPGLGYELAAIIPAHAYDSAQPSRWRDLLRHHGADLLVIADEASDDLAACLLRDRVPLAVMPRPNGLPVHGFERTSFISHDTVLFTYDNNLARPVARATKLAFDLAVALLLLVVTLPVMLAIAAAVSLDGGPVLYAHRRVGADGRPFGCLKFRSMVPDADAVLHHLLETDGAAAAEWADTQKLRADPRITTIGRLLRRTSLDELPQLLNVLRLEMSLVGPRPIVAAEIPRYGDEIAYYYETRPGLTGLWQVSGRSETGYGYRVRLDTWYVKNWSVWNDLVILARTIPAVLQRRGAR